MQLIIFDQLQFPVTLCFVNCLHLMRCYNALVFPKEVKRYKNIPPGLCLVDRLQDTSVQSHLLLCSLMVMRIQEDG